MHFLPFRVLTSNVIESLAFADLLLIPNVVIKLLAKASVLKVNTFMSTLHINEELWV